MQENKFFIDDQRRLVVYQFQGIVSTVEVKQLFEKGCEIARGHDYSLMLDFRKALLAGGIRPSSEMIKEMNYFTDASEDSLKIGLLIHPNSVSVFDLLEFIWKNQNIRYQIFLKEDLALEWLRL